MSTEFPHGLRIHVVEQLPAAVLTAAGHRLAVSADGTVLREVRPARTVPVIAVRALPVGPRVTDPVQDQEDLCATACAVYAVLLAAHGRGLVGYWRTPEVLRNPAGLKTLGIPPGERFVALIHLGWPRQEKEPPPRLPAEDVVSYLA